jgi:pseudouridine synthase
MARPRTLDRQLSNLGLCSRGVAEQWIAEGRVRVNGRVARSSETWVDLERDELAIDGRAVRAAKPVHVVLHKPKGYLTSLGDPRGRRTVYDLLLDLPDWVFPVGRLDLDTSGLLLFTNDTELGERVASPANKLAKRYRATTRSRIATEELARLAAGVELQDGPTLPARARLIGHRGPTSLVELEIHEGRNRQVRRMFQAVGRPLKELRRVAIGPLELGDLPSGRWRELTEQEEQELRAALRRRPSPSTKSAGSTLRAGRSEARRPR